jgi:membrane dipeptidase
MNRRRFIASLASIGLVAVGAPVRGQPVSKRLADMHTHLGFRSEVSPREAMARGGMFLIAEKITPDGPLLQRIAGRLTASRAARPGEIRRNFERALARRMKRLQTDGLGIVDSAQALAASVESGEPAVVIAAEGADFLEGEIGYLDKVRAQGLVHLQLVHYYMPSLVGDVSTEPAVHQGLTAFGRELVAACNRLGILVDVAHCTSAGIEHALDASTKPVIYSHGQVSQNAPHSSQNVIHARAIHAPLARRIADKGGVIGVWPLWSQFAHLDLYADEIVAMVKQFGAQHVGVGTDMYGLPRSVVPTYEEFAKLADLLPRRGLNAAEVDAVLGGNYVRVLREAITV